MVFVSSWANLLGRESGFFLPLSASLITRRQTVSPCVYSADSLFRGLQPKEPLSPLSPIARQCGLSKFGVVSQQIRDCCLAFSQQFFGRSIVPVAAPIAPVVRIAHIFAGVPNGLTLVTLIVARVQLISVCWYLCFSFCHLPFLQNPSKLPTRLAAPFPFLVLSRALWGSPLSGRG